MDLVVVGLRAREEKGDLQDSEVCVSHTRGTSTGKTPETRSQVNIKDIKIGILYMASIKHFSLN